MGLRLSGPVKYAEEISTHEICLRNFRGQTLFGMRDTGGGGNDIAHLRQECHNSKFGIFDLLV
jgi:hypothetical protein